MKKKLRKDGVHACVLRIFFFAALFIKIVFVLLTSQNIKTFSNRKSKSVSFYVKDVVIGCARIDNNRREYCEKMCESWCTCVCAPHFFFILFAQLCKLMMPRAV